MRKLAIFSCAFAAATAAYVWLIPQKAALICAAVFGILFLALFLWRSDTSKRMRIACAAISFALLWAWGYETRNIAPLREYCSGNTALSVEVSSYPEATEYGCRVEAKIDGGTMLLYLDDLYDLKPGDQISLEAEVIDVSGNKNDNLYYQARDISLLAFQNSKATIITAQSIPMKYWPASWAQTVKTEINEQFPDDTEGFVRALLLGDRSGISYTAQNQMSVVGISHVFSVSGMHVSLIVGFVMLLLRKKRIAAMVAMLAMLIFAAMLGFSPSVTRACIMNSVLLLAPILKRENDPWTSLSFALMVILLGNPWSIASLSLQLSFLSMAGIFLFSAKIYHRIVDRIPAKKKWSKRAVAVVALSLATTFGATSLTTPLIAANFGMISLVAPLANLILLFLVSTIFTCSFAVLLAGLIQPLGVALAGVLSHLIRFVLAMVRYLSKIPYAAVYTDNEYISAWLVIAYVLILCFLLFKKGRRVLHFVGALAATLVCAISFSMIDVPNASFTMLDVGQGQGILMQSGNFTVMVDCGGDEGERNGETAVRKLMISGQFQLDALILTHYDTDHSGGVELLLDCIDVEHIFLPAISDDSGRREAVIAAAEKNGVNIHFVTENISLDSADARVRIIKPFGNSSDNEGLCALMYLGECDILITGDMSTSAENRLIAQYDLPDLEVLIAGHHGSKYSTGQRLLEATRPEVVLISVGKNSYGHPSKEVLDRIASIGAVVYRTDENGEITIMR